MSHEILRISPIEDRLSLASCTPNLMPFHIAYSGPAPISTFFRVQENTEPVAGASSIAEPSPTPPTSNSRLVGRMTKRLVAAFRGRVVQGVVMALPDGYGGLVLRSNATTRQDGKDEKKKGRESKRGELESLSRRGTRSTRKSRSSPEPVREGEDVDMDTPVTENPRDDEHTKVLKASHIFSSLVIWNPDILVDQGKDEYTRALSEWTAVAAELHRPEDD